MLALRRVGLSVGTVCLDPKEVHCAVRLTSTRSWLSAMTVRCIYDRPIDFELIKDLSTSGGETKLYA